MPEYLAPLRRDPLSSLGDRLPVGLPRGTVGGQEEQSGAAARPFLPHHVVARGPGSGSRPVDSALPPAAVNKSEALTELARFFAIAADCSKMCPMFSALVDQTWHILLATPDSYAKFSRRACGQILGHEACLGEGWIPWVPDYEARFGKLPPLWFADVTGEIDQTAYAAYCVTGEVFRSWDCTPVTDDDEE